MKRTLNILGWAGFTMLFTVAAATTLYAAWQIYGTNPMLLVSGIFSVATLSSVALTWSDS